MPSQNYSKKLKRLKEAIEESKLPDKQKELIKSFSRDLKIHDYSDARNHKLVTHIKRVCEENEIDLNDPSKEELKDALYWIKTNDDFNAASTKRDYRVAIRVFYKWLKKDNPQANNAPEIVDWISATLNGQPKLPSPKELLKPSHVYELIQKCYNIRDKALIATLWETGARIGELMDAKKENVDTEYNHGVKITLNMEKESGHYLHRTLPLHTSSDYVQKYLNHRFGPSEPKDPLFVSIQNQSHIRENQRITYNNIRRILRETFDRAEIDKPNNPHIFRHSRATYLAQEFTEAEIRKWFGWSQNSDMPGRYIHLANQDLEDAVANLHDLNQEENQKNALIPKSCPKCGNSEIGATQRWCGNCGAPLDPDVVNEVEEKESDALNFIFSNEAVRKQYLKHKKTKKVNRNYILV